jgi:ABC-type polysaccharide/polyol phosphate export permease
MEAIQGAFGDIIWGVKLAPLWLKLGWEQTLARFRRTVLGPFWLTANLLAIAFALSFVFGALLGVDWRKNFAMIITGILSWGIAGAYLSDAANVFISAGDLMQTMKLPLSFHIFLMMFKNFINFAAQLIALWVVLGLMGLGAVPTWELLISLPLVLAIACLVSLIIGMPATRFRDINQTILFAVQLLFFITPIFWSPSQMGGKRGAILSLNPFAHVLELVRQPLLGRSPSMIHWEWGFGTFIVLSIVAMGMLVLYRKRVVFWL